MTQIEQIKAEIKRHIAHYEKIDRNDFNNGELYICQELLSFIESLEKKEAPKIKDWVARTKCGHIFLYETKPTRASDFWFERNAHFQEIDCHTFPNLKWEDEPIEVELIIHRV